MPYGWTGEPRLRRLVCFDRYPSCRDGALCRAVSGQLENLTRLSTFRYCRVIGLGCHGGRCVGWRARVSVRCPARWRALGYRALVSPSLVIRDRCPKPNTCRATALSGVTLLVTGHGSGRSCRHAGRIASIYCGHNRACECPRPWSQQSPSTPRLPAPASRLRVSCPRTPEL